MRYTGPRGKAFSGDKVKARSLQRAVDLLVGRVIKRLLAPPFNGEGYLVDWKRLTDGSTIWCMVSMIGMHPVVRTWVDSPTASDKSDVVPLLRTYDAGYLNVDDLSQFLDYGVTLDDELADWLGYIGCYAIGDAYFNPRDRLELPHLYALKEDFSTEYVEKPISFWAEVSGGGAQAAACAQSKIATIVSANPMTYATGKMRLYQQAKLGTQLSDTCAFSDRVIANDHNGIIQDETGKYYVAEINAMSATPEVVFTPLDISETLLAEIGGQTNLFDVLRAETEALAYSSVSNGTAYSARILENNGLWTYPNYGEGLTPASPMAGGWKFSWSTNEAAIVLHRAVRVAGSDALFFYKRADIESYVYKIHFAREPVIPEGGVNPVYRFVPRIELIETAQWQYQHIWHWWFPIVDETTTRMWEIPDGPSASTEDIVFPLPNSVPLYGYYTANNRVENNTLSLLRVSRAVLSSGPAIESGIFGEKGYGLFNGAAMVDSYEYDENTALRITTEFCGETVSGVSRGVLKKATVTGGLGGQWTPEVSMDTPYRPPSGLFSMSYDAPGVYQQIYWSGVNYTVGEITTPSFESVGYCPYGGHIDYNPEIAPPASYGTYRHVSYYQVSGSFTQTRSENQGSRSDPTPRFAIPLADAESLILLKTSGARVTSQPFTYTYNKDTWGVRDDDAGYYLPADANTYPCGGTYPDLNSPVSVGSSENWGPIYDVLRTVQQGALTEYVAVNDTMEILGKDGRGAVIRFACAATTEDADIQKTNGKSCLIYSPMDYLSSYRLISDPTWLFGVNIAQGVFGAKRAATLVREFADYGLFVPSKREWLRQTGVAGGWPDALVDDDRTLPIGWA